MKLAIIGTAGRGDDASRLNIHMWDRMYSKLLIAMDVVETLANNKITRLVSGGAAWADHLAVHHFIHGKRHSLELHVPCNWNFMKSEYDDTGVRDFRTNPGGTLNYYHRKMPFNSLEDIASIVERSFFVYGGGFHQRNTRVAQNCDALVALTFGNGRELKDGGTADTVRKFLARPGIDPRLAIHIDLNTMLGWTSAQVKAA